MREHELTAEWRPLLEGDLRRHALEAIAAISDDLRNPPPASDPGTPEAQSAVDEVCLGRGRAGLALFSGYKALLEDDEDAARDAATHLDEAFEGVARLRLSPSLFVGFTGVAWATERLERELFRTDEDSNEDIDGALLRFVSSARDRVDYDLITGLVGVGVYCLDRGDTPVPVECLELVVDRLASSAVATDDGIAWFTPPEMLPSATRDEFTEGFYNLGMAHGIPGVIALLAGIYAHGIAMERVRPLLDAAVDWVVAQRIEGDERSQFPAVVAPGRSPEAARTAWCYGDPGIAAALFVAAHATGRSDWWDEAIRLATAVARRPVEHCGVDDAGLCHGAAGIAHILNRLSVATGDQELEDAARSWFARTLEMRSPGTGVGGYRTWRSGRGGAAGWIDHPGLLTGAAGIGLALLAATGTAEPSWDRCLLISIAPERSRER